MQRWALALAVFFALLAAATACEKELHHGWWPLKVHHSQNDTVPFLNRILNLRVPGLPSVRVAVLHLGFAHSRNCRLHRNLDYPFITVHSDATRHPH